MIKLIQTAILTTVVFSPLTLVSLISSAAAHHTSTHVSTVATAISQTTKKKTTKVAIPARLLHPLARPSKP